MGFFSDCHKRAREIRLVFEGKQKFAENCRKAMEILDGFVFENSIDTGDGSPLGSFFREFKELLEAASGVSDGSNSAEADLLMEFCGAMGNGVNSMRSLLRSLQPVADRVGRSAETAEDPRQLRRDVRIPATILILEDDDTFARSLESAMRVYFEGDSRFAIEVVRHVPERDVQGRITETQVDFGRRLERRLLTLAEDEEPSLMYLQAAVVDYALTALALDTDRPNITGIDLAKMVHVSRPETLIGFLSGEDVLDLVEKTGTRFGPVYWKHDPHSLQELFKAVRRSLEEKYHTPFWDALRSFTERPLSTFHAMPLARARSLQSTVLGDFRDYFGQNYFDAETSATGEPLDSLLHPTGSIKRAEKKAARTFGASETFFVTNGTSTANKIVLQGLLERGDAVLLDRNCHVSHHYGVALLGARPFYLEPYYLPQYGIGGGVPLVRIEESLRQHIERYREGAETAPLPKLLMLTNRTFDGILTKPRTVIERVRMLLCEEGDESWLRQMAFFFDEAWFAYGRFHPFYVEFTSLAVAEQLGREDPYYEENLRVYATQSTHKTLSAFRQGSMIHVRDPFVRRTDAGEKFELAFRTHTTTSPHSGIISSLDVASRQMSLEGCAQVNRALYWARRFRVDAKTGVPADHGWRERFHIVTASEMVPAEFGDDDGWEFQLDPTCITIHFASGWHGDELKHRLLTEHDVQINKHSENTILMMVTLGSSFSDIVAMKMALMRVAADLERRESTGWRGWAENPTGYAPPPFSGFWEGEVNGHQPGVRHEIEFFVENRQGWPTEWVELKHAVGRVGANYISPYPPGYPILIPGQVVDDETVGYLDGLHSREIHGLKSDGKEKVLRVFSIE